MLNLFLIKDTDKTFYLLFDLEISIVNLPVKFLH